MRSTVWVAGPRPRASVHLPQRTAQQCRRSPLPRLCSGKNTGAQVLRFPETEAAWRKHTCSGRPRARASFSRGKPPRVASPALFPKGTLQRGTGGASSAPPVKACPFILLSLHTLHTWQRAKNTWISRTHTLALRSRWTVRWREAGELGGGGWGVLRRGDVAPDRDLYRRGRTSPSAKSSSSKETMSWLQALNVRFALFRTQHNKTKMVANHPASRPAHRSCAAFFHYREVGRSEACFSGRGGLRPWNASAQTVRAQSWDQGQSNNVLSLVLYKCNKAGCGLNFL